MIGATTKRLLAGLTLALLLGVGAADFAGAERVPTGGDSAQQGCRALQDQYLALRSEYANATAERGLQIINEMANIEKSWTALGCGNVWGKIYQTRVILTEPLVVRPVGGIEVEEMPVLAPVTVVEAVEPTGGIELVEAAPAAELTDTAIYVPEGEQGVVVIDEPVPPPVTDEQP